MVFWLEFLFSNNPSKSTGSPLREAEVKAVKVVNFVAMWLNLYPHTVNQWYSGGISLRLFIIW